MTTVPACALLTLARALMTLLGKRPTQGQRMQNAASRMQTLIEDLLTLSRVTSRGEPFILVNLKHIVEEVASDLEILIQETGATVEVQ